MLVVLCIRPGEEAKITSCINNEGGFFNIFTYLYFFISYICKILIGAIIIAIVVGGGNEGRNDTFYPYPRCNYVYLATGSDPSGGFVAAVGSSGAPGGVGSRARRLGRI